MSRKNTKKLSAGDAKVDVRMAIDALMEVNQQLQRAGTACRAIVYDMSKIKDPELSKQARRLLSIVEAMETGPNKAAWEPLQVLEKGAQAAYAAADAAEKAAHKE